MPALGWQFLLTAAILWSTRYAIPRATATRVTALHAILIGLAQALAIVPAISRSATCCRALERASAEAAAEFSFIMSIIVIAGSGVMEARHLRREGRRSPFRCSPRSSPRRSRGPGDRWLVSLLPHKKFHPLLRTARCSACSASSGTAGSASDAWVAALARPVGSTRMPRTASPRPAATMVPRSRRGYRPPVGNPAPEVDLLRRRTLAQRRLPSAADRGYRSGQPPCRPGARRAHRAMDPPGARIAIKWPNDLYIDDRKAGGILVEARWREIRWAGWWSAWESMSEMRCRLTPRRWRPASPISSAAGARAGARCRRGSERGRTQRRAAHAGQGRLRRQGLAPRPAACIASGNRPGHQR